MALCKQEPRAARYMVAHVARRVLTCSHDTMLVCHMAVNGSVIEVSKQGVPLAVLECDDRRPSREERYFGYVHEGDCINKSQNPSLKVLFTPNPPLHSQPPAPAPPRSAQ